MFTLTIKFYFSVATRVKYNLLKKYPSNKTKNIFGCRFTFIFLFTKRFVCQFHLQHACSVWAYVIWFCVFTLKIKFYFSVATWVKYNSLKKKYPSNKTKRYIWLQIYFHFPFLFTKTFVCQFHLQRACSVWAYIIWFCVFTLTIKFYFSVATRVKYNLLKNYPTQCPRTDLCKRFLPKPMTTTGWKETP